MIAAGKEEAVLGEVAMDGVVEEIVEEVMDLVAIKEADIGANPFLLTTCRPIHFFECRPRGSTPLLQPRRLRTSGQERLKSFGVKLSDIHSIGHMKIDAFCGFAIIQ